MFSAAYATTGLRKGIRVDMLDGNGQHVASPSWWASMDEAEADLALVNAAGITNVTEAIDFLVDHHGFERPRALSHAEELDEF